MAIVINPSDPGAVPGASTNILFNFIKKREYLWGRHRIDEGVKGMFLLGIVPPYRAIFIVANDNYKAEARMAA